MCRLTLYKGKAILIGDLVCFPDNSLLCQSRDARYHPGVIDDKKNKRNILVNGDGFGVAWYTTDRSDRGACVFKFITPAWSDMNLRSIGEHVESSLIMAHIRAASSGHEQFEDAVVSNENCHPFRHGRYTFMHNGSLPHFKRMKRGLLNLLQDEVFHGITGTTDSEHIFALFLNLLPNTSESVPIATFIEVVEQTMTTLLHLASSSGINEPASLNIVVCDGINVIATRFRSGKEAPPSLYYNWGSDFVCHDGHFTGRRGCAPREIVISSAPLSRETDSRDDLQSSDTVGQWILMPKDHMLVVVGDPSGKDVSVVQDVYLRPLVLDGFDYRLASNSNFPSASSMASLEVSEAPEMAVSWSQWQMQSTDVNVQCNRLRVVGSRDGTPRGSLCDADAPSLGAGHTASSSSSSSSSSSCKKPRGLGGGGRRNAVESSARFLCLASIVVSFCLGAILRTRRHH